VSVLDASALLACVFDDPAAVMFAEIAAHRKTSGRPISQFDAMMAAIARSRCWRRATPPTSWIAASRS
jgi:predicted nucleic acid-binding protein